MENNKINYGIYQNFVSEKVFEYIQNQELLELLMRKGVSKIEDMRILEIICYVVNRTILKFIKRDINVDICTIELTRVDGFVHGWFKQIPRDWSYARYTIDNKRKFEKLEKDPEWIEYQRLKAKFKDQESK